MTDHPSERAPRSGARIPNPLAREFGSEAPYAPNSPAYASTGHDGQRRSSKAPAGWILATALVGGIVLGGAAGGGASLLLTNFDGRTQIVASESEGGVEAVSSSVVEQVQQSVVTVDVTAANAQGSGSGVAVASGGYIVTNNHVVSLDGQASNPQITVTTADGQILQAQLVGADAASDLAVIRVEQDLPILPFTEAPPAVGEQTIAVGAPLGLSNSVTEGIVSATGRGLTVGTTEEDDESPYRFWSQQGPEEPQQTVAVPALQTDASVNPGNSGGALVNADGQLVGINVAIATTGQADADASAGSIGIGFAIEGQLVQRVVEEIIADGAATHGQLGVTVSDQTDAAVGVQGALVQETTSDGPGEAAGLEPGDVITAVEGRAVSNATDLTAFVRAAAAGSEIELEVTRDGENETVTVELGGL